MRPISTSGFLLLAAGLVCIASELMAAPPVSSPIPLEKGNRWIYEGKIGTTLSGSSTVYTTNISWMMEVVDSIKSTNAQAAIVSGFPDELSWYEPAQVPGFCVLLNFSNHVYQFKAPNEKQARAILQDVINEPGKFSTKAKEDDELFALPLAKDKRWGSDLQREDSWYCWHVEKEQSAKLQIKGYSENSTPKVFTLAYRTNPDHQLLDIVPGLGITHFIYVHHGTVAWVDLHLVAFKRHH